jgi:hypothetical protein
MIDAHDLLVTAAYERAAAALAGALEEMRDSGRPLPEGAQAILLKHLLAHFDGLEAQYRGVLDHHLEEELRAAFDTDAGRSDLPNRPRRLTTARETDETVSPSPAIAVT